MFLLVLLQGTLKIIHSYFHLSIFFLFTADLSLLPLNRFFKVGHTLSVFLKNLLLILIVLELSPEFLQLIFLLTNLVTECLILRDQSFKFGLLLVIFHLGCESLLEGILDLLLHGKLFMFLSIDGVLQFVVHG